MSVYALINFRKKQKSSVAKQEKTYVPKLLKLAKFQRRNYAELVIEF